jgi:hypothetical protein
MFLSGVNITPQNAATSSVHLLSAPDASQLDNKSLYHSDITPLGVRWVKELRLAPPPEQDMPGKVRETLDSLWKEAKLRIKQSHK